MAEILNYFDASAPREVIQQAVEALSGGELVGLPFDTSYAICGSAGSEQIPGLLDRSEPDAAQWALACTSREAAADCLGPTSELQSRLVSRLWPGPALIRLRGVGLGGGDSLPPAVASMVRVRDAVQLVVPESPLCRQVLQALPGPVVFAVAGGNTAENAAELERRCAAGVRLIVDAGPTLRRYPLTVLDVSEDAWSVARPGAIPERTVAEAACRQVLFVCSGNTCRSPMAERLFRKLLATELECREGDLIGRGISVRSAGLAAFDGGAASPEAVELMRENAIDLSDHQSRRADAGLLLHSDHVLTMTRMHRETILQQYPELADRVRTMAPDGTDVSDPFGGGMEDYRRCRDQLESFLKTFASSFLNEISGGGTS